MKPRTERLSNIELLRIISMLMILLVHADGASLGLPEPAGHLAACTARDIWRLAVESLAIIGVNCFTMISGYFGIRLRWRGVLTFLFQCAWYSVGIYTCLALLFPAKASLQGWLESWLVISHTDLWYVPAYFCLMLLSPILNAGLDALDRRTYRAILAVFTLLTCWSGWWWGASFNPTGYTVMQLIYIYTLARYIRLHTSGETSGPRRRTYIIMYACATLGIFISALYLPSLRAFAYNSPFVIAASVALFLVFRAITLRSPLINYTARSAFAVYLIHKAPLVWGGIMKPSVIALWHEQSLTLFTFSVIGIVIGIYAFTMLIDILRRKVSQLIFR